MLPRHAAFYQPRCPSRIVKSSGAPQIFYFEEQHRLVGEKKFVRVERSARGVPAWAVLHDPEGHNVLLLPARKKI